MQDRFKFRVRYKNKSKLHNVGDEVAFSCQLDQNGDLWTFDTKLPSSDFIVEFCTGLKDKNGKLIYEGDILSYEKYDIKEPVVFEYSKFSIKSYRMDGDLKLDCWFDITSDYEIIGNIHEDKEILK